MLRLALLLTAQSLYLSTTAQKGDSVTYTQVRKLSPDDSSYTTRNAFWFTPGKVDKINGFTIGMWPENTKGYSNQVEPQYNLTINGLYLEINPIMFFGLIRGTVNKEHQDSIEYYLNEVKNNYVTTLNGLTLSVLGTHGDYRHKGVCIGGIKTLINEVDGVEISGLNNAVYELNGAQISIIRNRATIAKGVQIGLINKTNDLRGLQFGLWNINGRRKLPFINWQFSPRKQRNS